MSAGTQVKRVARPTVVANSSTNRTRVVGEAVKRHRIGARVTSGKAGGPRRKVGSP